MLSSRQKTFCDFFIETGNATEAYRRAGYTAKGKAAESAASRLLSNVKVRAYIDARLEQKESERIASQDEVLEHLTSVMRGEVTETIPVALRGHYEMVVKPPNISDRLRAAEALGKRYGLFTDRLEHTGTMVVITGEDGLED